jgi:hypothetical protein
MQKAKKKDNRAAVEAARKTSRSQIIAAIIAAGALLMVTILGIIYSNYRKEEREKVKSENHDTTRNIDSIKNPEIHSKPKNNYQGSGSKSAQEDYFSQLRTIDDLITYKQEAQAYRAYLKLYNSLPLSLKNKINKQKMIEASEKYDLGKWKEAALQLKENIEPIIKNKQPLNNPNQ